MLLVESLLFSPQIFFSNEDVRPSACNIINKYQQSYRGLQQCVDEIVSFRHSCEIVYDTNLSM